MRLLLCLVFLLFPCAVLAAEQIPAGSPAPVELEFSGYRFGQHPAANMVCYSGYCKSQAPGGDGQIDFPFSVYETPGAVSTLSGLAVVNPRYTFWDNHLYRVYFRVDCSPLEMSSCLEDIVKTLDREYGLTPLVASDIQQFIEERHVVTREFRTDSGAFIRVRSASQKDQQTMPSIDIIDQEMAAGVATSVVSTYRQKNTALSEVDGKP